jgi:hypothetical protein
VAWQGGRDTDAKKALCSYSPLFPSHPTIMEESGQKRYKVGSFLQKKRKKKKERKEGTK